MKKFIAVIGCLFIFSSTKAEDNQLLPLGGNRSVNDTPDLTLPNPHSLLRHLTINSAIQGAVILGELTLIGLTNVTNSNNYHLPTLALLAGGSLIGLARERYLMNKMSTMPGTEKYVSRVKKLKNNNGMDIGVNVVGLGAVGAAMLTNHTTNNVLTNCILAVSLVSNGELWSTIYNKFRKYKKIKNTL